MTRYAKSGNSQKHQKMPEDPTPWEELVTNVKKLKKESFKNRSIKQQSVEAKSTKESISQQDAINNHSVEENEDCIQKSKTSGNVLPKKQLKKLDLKKNKKRKFKLNPELLDQSEDAHLDDENSMQDYDQNEDLSAETESSEENFPVENTLTKSLLKEPKSGKKKRQKFQLNAELPNKFSNENVIEPNSLEEGTENSLSHTNEDGSNIFANQKCEQTTDKPLSRRQLKKLKRENRKEQDTTSDVEHFNQAINTTTDCQNNLKNCPQSSSVKKNSRKKELFLQRLQKKRTENGITLLSPKMERKLYMIKRRLREKGFTPEMIKEIIRKERRKAETELRKPITNKTCFNCRKPGHILADCPLPASGGSNPETGICFKCGSTEHTSFRCAKKISGYPFATCFICKKSGHISRECPDNKHGVYIRGGKCNLCGNVNHFRKDCPSLNKREKEQTSASVHTIFEGSSIDDEITEFKTVPVKKRKLQKTKIVKF